MSSFLTLWLDILWIINSFHNIVLGIIIIEKQNGAFQEATFVKEIET